MAFIGRVLLIAVAFGAANPGALHAQEPPPPRAPPDSAEPFHERISGTTVRIEMVPIPPPATTAEPAPGTEARTDTEPAGTVGQDPAAEADPTEDGAADDGSLSADPEPSGAPSKTAADSTQTVVRPAAAGSTSAAANPIGPPDGLWMSAQEITWDAFDAFVYRLDKADPDQEDAFDAVLRPSQPFVLADRGYGHNGYPVISVNHSSATAFCKWLSAKTGRRYRLPTQAEWEHAARAGDDSWALSSRKGLEALAWTRQNAERSTHPVGSLTPNPWGLFDILGNAAEWCLDPDGAAVVRGGSFQDRAQDVSWRSVQQPTPAWNATDPQLPKSPWYLADAGFVGFRIVCEDGPDG